jgi:hypothetical protein
VSESWNTAEFFANKLLREFRGVNEAQVAWVQALKVSSSSSSSSSSTDQADSMQLLSGLVDTLLHVTHRLQHFLFLAFVEHP